MIQIENFLIIDEKYKSGIGIDVYKNEINLCTAYLTQDNKIINQWVFPQNKNRQPSTKAIPHKISLGLKQQAIQRLEQLLLMVEKL